jgi:hypothetical protein
VGSTLVINNVIPSTSKCEGDSITFTVNASGGELSYQWTKDGTNITNATKSTLAFQNLRLSKAGIYSCIISNACGSKSLPNFELSVKQKPKINISPVTFIKNTGDDLTFSISPEGTLPFSFSWYKDEEDLGIHSEQIIINNITSEDAGVYTCVVTNECGSITSKVGTLIVTSDIKYSIVGHVRYDNAAQTAISNATVSLETQEGLILSTTTTGSGGEFEFTEILNGFYKIVCTITLEWGGSNPVDALYTNRSYLGTYTFTNLLKEIAADVNNSKTINPVDALLINKRYIRVINKFLISDWLFDPEVVGAVIVNGSNIDNLEIKVVCAGDVDGSYPKKYKMD